ncbi:ABC transporter substrate-binding protein [Rickettsiales endosymbiont of Peranema trichophorum]|uniref:ABC transporter substrate-binding protein n=1 Tax=Rickettsiales endosymbiont of Peranema trichophorum TaxID=2486577 RepID=UPI001A92A1CC|nr:ABC transporter substrate-binding protein [Rickettsiales endosymbiont of Peranema trichophorum]
MSCEANEIGASRVTRIFVTQFVQHPALDMTVKGIVDGLNQHGYEMNKNLLLRRESAQGSSVLASQIATKFVSQEPDLVVALGTVSAQSFGKYARDGKIKLVFSSITDPLKSGLVDSMSRPGRSTAGVSNFVPLEPQLELFKRLQPNLRKLGFIYNPSELNSTSLLKSLQILSPQFNLVVVPQAANKTSDIPQSTMKLIKHVDAIFISNDNTALSALGGIIKIANAHKKPVYVSDTDAVANGALAALGPNQYKIGLQTAELIVDILKGGELGHIPVQSPDGVELYLNEDVAVMMGIQIPDDLRGNAVKIIRGGDERQ